MGEIRRAPCMGQHRLARLGPAVISAIRPLSDAKRTLNGAHPVGPIYKCASSYTGQGRLENIRAAFRPPC